MKNSHSFLTVIVLLVAFYACKTKSSFPEAIDAFPMNQHAKVLKKYNEGFYQFQLCIKDTTIFDTSVQWYTSCDANNTSYDTIEHLSLAFIDETRAVLLNGTIAKNDRFSLDRFSKRMRLGIYTIDNATGAVPIVKIKLRSPRTSSDLGEYSELRFEFIKGSLYLQSMTYLTADNDLVDLTRRKQPLFKGDDAKQPKVPRTIKPGDAFAFGKMEFSFQPVPFYLVLHKKDTVLFFAHEWRQDSLIRYTYFKKDTLREVIRKAPLSSTVSTW